MRLSIIDVNTMKIEHPHQQTRVASIREFSKTRFVKDRDDGTGLLDPFKEINLFIHQKVSQENQLKLYNAYATIFAEFLDGCYDVDIVMNVVNEQFKIIYDIIKVQDVQVFMERNNLFDIPPDIEKNYTVNIVKIVLTLNLSIKV